jgi:hypothetical protein
VSLTVGELQVRLSGDQRPLERALDTVDRRVDQSERKITASFDRAGKESGGRLAQGINAGLTRASPLIVAGVTGALAAGAPAVLAASTLMFAGIGAAAAAQNDEVRAAWAGLGDLIQDEARNIAAPVTSTFTEMADSVGESFLRMKPTLIATMGAIAPQIEDLTGSVLQMAENALPGMARAAQNATPAVAGLGSFLESTGSGLGEFFSIISQHAPAAGTAMAALGDIVGDLLPTLGELLGSGAELASIVLPPLADAMSGVADAAQTLGPILPAIALGITALKVAGTVGGSLTTLAQSLAMVSYSANPLAGAAGKASTAIGLLGRAAPIAALGLTAYSLATADSSDRVKEWSDTLLQGGAAAATLKARADEANDTSFWDTFKENLLFRDVWDENASSNIAEDFDAAKAGAEALSAAMTPLEAAQQGVTTAQNNLDLAIAQHGPTSAQATAAAGAYRTAQAELEYQAGQTELALSGVTQAMIDQANQALAAIDSGFAYQNSLNGLEDAQTALAEAQAHLNDENVETRTTTEDVERAQLALAEQNYRTALAFGQQQADMSGAGKETAEYARIVQEQALAELYRLRDAAGPEMAGALNQQIAMLESSGVSLAATGTQARVTADRMRDLGLSVTEIPNQKYVRVEAPTEDQKRRLQDLGYIVTTLPNGDIYVSADTATAEAALNNVARNRYSTIFTRVVTGGGSESLPNNGQRAAGLAAGGIVHAFANGGFEPMRGGIAQVVPPNTWRVIGDRVRDDEAYIPINQSPRSMDILAQTAQRMGGQFVPNGGATGTGSGSVTNRNYSYQAVIREEITPERFMALQRQVEAVYG